MTKLNNMYYKMQVRTFKHLYTNQLNLTLNLWYYNQTIFCKCIWNNTQYISCFSGRADFTIALFESLEINSRTCNFFSLNRTITIFMIYSKNIRYVIIMWPPLNRPDYSQESLMWFEGLNMVTWIWYLWSFYLTNYIYYITSKPSNRQMTH